MRLCLILLLAACGGATPKPGGGATSERAPADAALRPAGSGWFCAEGGDDLRGGCFRDEAMCTAVRDETDPPCAAQATAFCHTHFFVPAKETDFFCLPTEALCDARVLSWSTPPTDYRDVSACAAWD